MMLKNPLFNQGDFYVKESDPYESRDGSGLTTNKVQYIKTDGLHISIENEGDKNPYKVSYSFNCNLDYNAILRRAGVRNFLKEFMFHDANIIEFMDLAKENKLPVDKKRVNVIWNHNNVNMNICPVKINETRETFLNIVISEKNSNPLPDGLLNPS